MTGTPRLLAVSDLHVAYPANREIVEELRPTSDGDWLLVAGDVAERVEDIAETLDLLRKRFARVVWVPGNHELWTQRPDPVQLRGEARYRHLVEVCRALDVVTPEDPYPIWESGADRVAIVPLFLLYDYTLRPEGDSKEQALARAYKAGVVCTDEAVLYPDPYPSRDAWCQARVESTTRRLDALPDDLRTVFVSHWPLHPAPTEALRLQDFALWCGTRLTADWHVRYRTAVAVYGHLHIPRTTWYDGVRFEEVSLGYPREWGRRGRPTNLLRQILPAPQTGPGAAASG